jgi:fatty acyl-CoA reductase
LELVINTCNIIINCAASIDFNQRLDGAIESNIKGSLRMQSLSRSIKNLDIFTHVSTCYVNCNMKGLINE